ncbi:MAG: hypothetical protein ACK5MZ_11160 [Aestuariibaculum sp.]
MTLQLHTSGKNVHLNFLEKLFVSHKKKIINSDTLNKTQKNKQLKTLQATHTTRQNETKFNLY